ncbi:MAG: hypothetical protein WA990_07965 [Rubrobacteraceae bacterium]
MPGETPQERGRREIVEDAISLVQLAIRRSRGPAGAIRIQENSSEALWKPPFKTFGI